MPIQWTEDLSTGVEEIDGQHKELFKRINNLLEASSKGKGKDEVGKVIEFLEDYILTHFNAEEDYMTRYDYPHYSAHKEQHIQFIKSFSDLKKKFKNEGPGVHIVVSANRIVVDWLINHIRKVDKSLGAFLKTKVQSPLSRSK